MKNKTLKKELITILIASLIFVTGLGIGRLCSYAASAGADGVVTSEASRALEETTAAVQPEEEKTAYGPEYPDEQLPADEIEIPPDEPEEKPAQPQPEQDTAPEEEAVPAESSEEVPEAASPDRAMS